MQSGKSPDVVLCPTVLLVDEVATEDAFQHREIAHAIAGMILDGEKGGCGIALTGSWGSGKSSVVKFLANDLLATNKDIRTFIFDAWAHQGDPLRRTFLEKLIEWCQEQEWTKSESDWLGTIDRLAKRREEIHTTNSPHLTAWGVAGALSLLITPVALAFYQKVHYAWHPYWESAALTLSTSPLIVAAVMAIRWLTTEMKKPRNQRRPIPSLIFTATENTIVSKTSKTPDPTSVEFEQYYRDLLSESLRENQRQIVIVIDNLDRVHHDDAKSIWATLRVFFDPSISGSGDWRKRVWVLVPFDPDAIQDLWANGPELNSASGRSMSRHFLEKTFQATFRVPRILLSNWETYLLQQLRVAFPAPRHTESEFHTIFRLFDRFPTADSGLPTPRNLKIFVNGLGALHRQWQDRIPLIHQAGFVLIANKPNEEILGILRAGETLQRPSTPYIFNNLLGDDWQKNLAALYFNVEPNIAYQVLLSQPIQKALQEGDGESLKALAENPGFNEVIESVIETTFMDSSLEADVLANAAIAFGTLRSG
jgi:hypothetical protein